MSKFSSKTQKTNIKSAAGTISKSDPDTTTFEGGAGWTKDDKTALFSLAVTNMVGEKTFYEDGGNRDKRFVDLIRRVAKDDPDWIARFIPYLRDEMNMRSAAVVMAVESIRALLGTKHKVNLRSMIDNACVRADEPAEILAYYAQEYGRNFPMPVKRGVADAVRRIYNERSALKWDGLSRQFRMGDVIELVHPEPVESWQSDVFKYLLDRRHSAEWPEGGYSNLPLIEKTHEIDSIPVEKRRDALLKGEVDFKQSGFTWERVSGWINGPMDAPVWEAIIPSMGYMALLRNLRNFEQANISKESIEYVRNKLSDPEEVARSRQFPYRFYSAYKNTNSFLWNEALEAALNLATENVPVFLGKTLVLVDVSGSMQMPISNNSKIYAWEIGAVVAGVIGARSEGADVVAFATKHKSVPIVKGTPALRIVDAIKRAGQLGGGTNTHQALAASYADHDRVIIVTDMQSHYYGSATSVLNKTTKKANIYNIDTRGYSKSNMPTGEKSIFEFAGFNDQMFKAIQMIEYKKNVGWPF